MRASDTGLAAGAGAAEIAIPDGLEMGGYAARTGTAHGAISPLLARAVVLEQRGRRIGLVSLDVLFATRDIVERIRHAAARDLDLDSGDVVVTATHTHSGPATLTERAPSSVVADVVAAATAALTDAASRLEPTMLKVAKVAVDGIGGSRRDSGQPVDESVRIILLERIATPEPIAVVFSHACHATVLESDNLNYAADWPGAACSVVENSVGGTAMFLQGCAGDINPVWLDHTHDETIRLGGIIGHAVATTVLQMASLGRVQRIVELRLLREVAVGARVGTLVDPVDLAIASRVVPLRPSSTRNTDALQQELDDLERRFADSDADGRDQIAPTLSQVRMHHYFQHGGTIASSLDVSLGGSLVGVEVSVIRLGDGHGIVTLPGEPLFDASVQVSDAIGLPDLMVVGYANGAVGYLPPCTEFERGGYEVGSTLFEKGALERLVEACTDAAVELRLAGDDVDR